MAKITEEYSCTLVGRFMKEWAIAEGALDEVIATSLKIDVVESWVIATTIPVYLKWNIAKTFVALSQMRPEDKQTFKEMEKEFNQLVADRNVLAHCMFFASEEEDVVKFLRVASRGTIKSTIIEWSESDFTERVERIGGFRKKMKILNEKVKESNLIPPPTLAEILSGTQTNPFAGLGEDS